MAPPRLVDDQLFGSHGSATTIAAAATFDLFDGGRRRAAAAAAAAEAEAGRADVERFADGVALEVRHAHSAARVALERHAHRARGARRRGRGVRIVEERFRAGVVKTIDVLDAATARREAEMRELVARADARAALLRLALAAGRSPRIDARRRIAELLPFDHRSCWRARRDEPLLGLLLLALARRLRASAAPTPRSRRRAETVRAALARAERVTLAGDRRARRHRRRRTSTAVSSRVMALVTAVHVELGDLVAAGQPLVSIDPTAAEGQVAQAEGALAQAEAAFTLAERNHERFEALATNAAASELELDLARMQYEQAQGAVDQAQGAVAAARSVATRIARRRAVRRPRRRAHGRGRRPRRARPAARHDRVDRRHAGCVVAVPERSPRRPRSRPDSRSRSRSTRAPTSARFAASVVEVARAPIRSPTPTRSRSTSAPATGEIASRRRRPRLDRQRASARRSRCPPSALIESGGLTLVVVRDDDGRAQRAS